MSTSVDVLDRSDDASGTKAVLAQLQGGSRSFLGYDPTRIRQTVRPQLEPDFCFSSKAAISRQASWLLLHAEPTAALVTEPTGWRLNSPPSPEERIAYANDSRRYRHHRLAGPRPLRRARLHRPPGRHLPRGFHPQARGPRRRRDIRGSERGHPSRHR